MNKTIEQIIAQLEQYINQAHQSGNKYDFIDPAYAQCSQLEELDEPFEAVEPLFLLIERSPAIDYGGPGPTGDFLESFYKNGYEETLIASIQRKPTVYTLHLLGRCINDNNNPHQADYLNLMIKVSGDLQQPENIRQEALEHISYAQEHKRED
jgi:hypothetical protein